MNPLQALQSIARTLQEAQLRVALALAALAEGDEHHSVRISTRKLAAAAGLSDSNLPAALARLQELHYITIRSGGPGTPNAYRVEFLRTVRGAPFAGAPSPEGAPVAGAQAPLFERRPAPFAEAPPTDNTGLNSPESAVDSSTVLPPILDRVLRSKVADHPQELVLYTRRWLHSYMAKLGRDETGQPYQPGHPPQLPDDHIVAQVLAVADPPHVFRILESLMVERKAAPYSYGWFVTVLLQRIHAITWQQTKKARAALAVVRAGSRPAPADTDGRQFTQETLAELGAIARRRAIR